MTAWQKVPENVRNWIGLISTAILLLVGAFGLGAATTDTAKELREMPNRITTVESRVEVVEAKVESVQAIQAESRCILRKMALNENAQECLPLFLGGDLR